MTVETSQADATRRDRPEAVPSREIDALLAIMAALRTPGTGCPWDLAQDFASIAPFTIEEAYEVADAIIRDDMADLQDELGDLLLQVVFYAQMARERGLFDFGGVVEAITAKMIRRHPHVFSDTRCLSQDAIKGLWAQIKAKEKADRHAARAAQGGPHELPGRLLAEVSPAQPALARAAKLQAKAATVGFDWDDFRFVIAKLREELGEVEAAVASADTAAIREEIGDLFFAAVNLARHLDIDSEHALRLANAKFERRFAAIESGLEARGQTLLDADLETMEALWKAAKRNEKK